MTRLAPSPTGALHLGNARTFLVTWALARRRGWGVALRIEDLDGPRVKPGASAQCVEDLRWLGLDWDSGPAWQRADLAPYAEALEKLRCRGVAYACDCSRREIMLAQSAPHAEDHELRYPGTCRPRGLGDADRAPLAWRLRVPAGTVAFRDEVAGPQAIDVQGTVGDFVVATRDGLPAYQLAVVVDDARQGVTEVVRGDDLLNSTGRQILLYRALGLTPLPRYWHLPLVVGPDGRRLAKRHGDTRLAFYRDRGVTPGRVRALLARWSGVHDPRGEMGADEFLERFDLSRLPRQAVTFTPEDHAWLLTR